MYCPPDDEPVYFYDTNVWYVGNVLSKFFDGKPDKITEWWFTPNPQLGYVAPAVMVCMGNTRRLAKFVQSAMTENPPRD